MLHKDRHVPLYQSLLWKMSVETDNIRKVVLETLPCLGMLSMLKTQSIDRRFLLCHSFPLDFLNGKTGLKHDVLNSLMAAVHFTGNLDVLKTLLEKQKFCFQTLEMLHKDRHVPLYRSLLWKMSVETDNIRKVVLETLPYLGMLSMLKIQSIVRRFLLCHSFPLEILTSDMSPLSPVSYISFSSFVSKIYLCNSELEVMAFEEISLVTNQLVENQECTKLSTWIESSCDSSCGANVQRTFISANEGTLQNHRECIVMVDDIFGTHQFVPHGQNIDVGDLFPTSLVSEAVATQQQLNIENIEIPDQPPSIYATKDQLGNHYEDSVGKGWNNYFSLARYDIVLNIRAPPNSGTVPRAVPVTTILNKENTEKTEIPSPNTERNEINNQHIECTLDQGPDNIHKPLGVDNGEKASGCFKNFNPSAVQPLSRQQTQHEQEQDRRKRAKVTRQSGEAHLQDQEDFGKSTQTYDNQPTDIVPEHYQTQLDPEKVTRTHNGEESHLIRATTPIPPQTVLSCNGQVTDITQPMCYQELESVNHEVLMSTNITEITTEVLMSTNITEITTEASEVNAPDNLNRPQASDRRVSVSSTENTFESTLVQTENEDNGSIFTEMDSLGGRTISQESPLVDTNDIDVLNNRLLSTNNAISSILQLANNGTTQTIENIGNCLPLSSSALPIRSEDETYISNDSTDNIDINRNTEFNCDQEKKLIKSLRIHVTQQLPVEASTQSREFPRVYNKLSEHNNADRKGENEDDCHVLRQVAWLSGEDLPIPSLDYTVAIVHSEAQKILERLAKGEHIGAHESMKYEILRVCTYRNYPGDGKPFRIQLASAGWYFASDSDEVVCYCCGLRKSGWKEIDNPMKIHELLRPTCDYLVKRSEVNIPIPELPAERAAKFNIFESNTSDSTIQSRQGERASNFDSDSSNPQDRFYTPPPKHPQYAELSTRLETFKKWPTNIPQTAQIMADCGYYYAGFGDCVRCFHCGIGLRHWTEDDYPWVEHARWSKNCAYLRLKKGIEFIQNVHLAIDNDEEPEDLVPETPSGRPADMSQTTPHEDSSQILLTDPAQSVLTMGYQPRIIKRAIDIILHKDGRSGITAQKIMETIFMLEERDATAAASNLQEGLANINISSASGGPDTQLKEAPNTSGGNAATGQGHGRARTQGNDKGKKDQQKDVKHSSKENRNNKEESKKEPQKHNEASAHSEEGGGTESKSKVKDTSKIKAENRKLKEQTVCKICLDKPVSIVFLPCGHLVTCAECAPAMRKCPICRALVKGRVKAFMS